MAKRILLVDDEKAFVELVRARLEPEFTVLAAGDGEEGLKLAAERKPDLIIADIVMPKMSGHEMLRVLRTTYRTKDVPCIMLTAVDESVSVHWARELGVVDYLTKPVRLEDLERLVRRHAG